MFVCRYNNNSNNNNNNIFSTATVVVVFASKAEKRSLRTLVIYVYIESLFSLSRGSRRRAFHGGRRTHTWIILYTTYMTIYVPVEYRHCYLTLTELALYYIYYINIDIGRFSGLIEFHSNNIQVDTQKTLNGCRYLIVLNYFKIIGF